MNRNTYTRYWRQGMHQGYDTKNVQGGVGVWPSTAMRRCYSNGRETQAWRSCTLTPLVDWSSPPPPFHIWMDRWMDAMSIPLERGGGLRHQALVIILQACFERS